MSVELNHTVVHVRSKEESAQFFAEILALPAPDDFGPFLVVACANGVSLDFMSTDKPIEQTHYAFLVSETEFDEIWGRIKARGLPFWGDPWKNMEGEINRRDGGRGLYFEEPSGHYLEILTRPYGSGS